MRHNLSAIDETAKTATCSVCGPNTPLAKTGRWRCRIAYRETKKNNAALPHNRDRQRSYMKNYYEENKSVWRKRTLLQKYGITEEDYDALLVKQDSKCAICGGPSTREFFDVDHCHDSGEVRGLLCSPCNTAIGLLKHDSKRLKNAIAYLSKT